jgi:UDP-N-acetylglucosamine diphosphorylase/glucosamine-1-phosphate N-acetyltransferase
MINFDKMNFLDSKYCSIDDSIGLIDKNNIFTDKSTIVELGCILDASNGPIILGKNVTIQAGSILKGPIFIDQDSTISNGAKLKGNILIGPNCKIGGEITNTIFHGYSNKVHDGFLGDSYIGEWVNFGANTNNSNLKNNYSHIRFNFSNKTIDTNKTFLGAMIGDFTRTGISTMINTGSYFGLGCNLFGGGFQEKYVQSFSWGKDSMVEFDKFINTIKIMKDRRSQKLSDTEINFLKSIYQKLKK